jgi:hypothetical protein
MIENDKNSELDTKGNTCNNEENRRGIENLTILTT